MVAGFICGTWDLFHAGHVMALEEASDNCGHLTVGIQAESPKRKPIQGLYERFVQVSACKYVDFVIPYSTEEDLEQLLKSYHIDVRFLGEDYMMTGKKITAEKAVHIIYLTRKHNFSTTKLIADIRGKK